MEQIGERPAVLLVEDEVLVRLSIADELRQAGLTVLEAVNADEAATILSSRRDAVGVVVTDLQMPGSIDGIGLVRLIRSQYPGIRIVVVSAARLEVLASLGADAVFSKPHNPDQLALHVKRLLDAAMGNGSRNSNAGRH